MVQLARRSGKHFFGRNIGPRRLAFREFSGRSFVLALHGRLLLEVEVQPRVRVARQVAQDRQLFQAQEGQVGPPANGPPGGKVRGLWSAAARRTPKKARSPRCLCYPMGCVPSMSLKAVESLAPRMPRRGVVWFS